MIGIYIHIPFCEHKCKYCDFLSFPGAQTTNKEKYLKALIREMSIRIQGRWKTPDTIFIGGGTPTALSTEELNQLLKSLGAMVDISHVKEFTCEANPGTVNSEKLAILKSGGVNRISFGVQSFDDILLQRIGRIHTNQEAVRAVELAQKIGFKNINIDLMYGLPGQTKEQWQESIQRALSLGVQHLSLYQLILEPYTAIVRQLNEGKLPPIDEDGAAIWFDEQREWLSKEGYHQYEISNYAEKGFESSHNQLYWRLEDYLGLGLGATSWQRPLRQMNTSDFSTYIKSLTELGRLDYEEEILSDSEQMSESVFMALRMNRGLELKSFEELYGRTVSSVFPKAIAQAIGNQWLSIQDGYLKLTDEGRRVGNWVFELFI